MKRNCGTAFVNANFSRIERINVDIINTMTTPKLPPCGRITPAFTRRDMLLQSGAGFGALALSYLLGNQAADAQTGAARPTGPLSAKQPHFAARAKSVIFCFME